MNSTIDVLDFNFQEIINDKVNDLDTEFHNITNNKAIVLDSKFQEHVEGLMNIKPGKIL